MDNLEKFERNMGKGKEIKLINSNGSEDIFYFKPLTVEFLPKLMRLVKIMEPSKEESEERNRLKIDLDTRRIDKSTYDNKLKLLDERVGNKLMEGDNSKLLIELLVNMVDLSYPELKSNPEVRDSFIYKNVMILSSVLMELNESVSDVDPEVLSQIEKLKQRVRSHEAPK